MHAAVREKMEASCMVRCNTYMTTSYMARHDHTQHCPAQSTHNVLWENGEKKTTYSSFQFIIVYGSIFFLSSTNCKVQRRLCNDDAANYCNYCIICFMFRFRFIVRIIYIYSISICNLYTQSETLL